MKKEILNRLFKDKLIEVYTNKNDMSKFHAGILEHIYEDSFIIKSYHYTGLTNGFVLIRNTDVYKINKDTPYLKRLAFLIKNIIQETIQNKYSELELSSTPDYGIDIVINECYKRNLLVSINLIYDVKIKGKIIKYDDEFIQIEQFSDYGDNEGISIIRYEDVENIYFDGLEENIITSLINEKQELL
ncbi:MAG: hypothetical protein LBT27_07925, partial [Prevotellaceae bacterium]|nr:hypothetical protein [Prevotellaceae bacterium]